MSPIPNHDEMIGVKQTANLDRNMRDAPRQSRAEQTPYERSDDGDERALPEKNRADIDPTITHRTQNRDLSYFGEDRHGEHVKNTEARQKNDERDRDRSRDSQSEENLKVPFFSFLPALRDMLK